MNKNKFVYILLIGMISFFGFQLDVYADLASEVKGKTCETLIKEGILDPKNESLLFDASGYKANCIYRESIDYWFEEPTCIILQVAFGTESDEGAYTFKHIGRKSDGVLYSPDSDSPFDVPVEKSYFAGLNGVCPISVRFLGKDCPNGDTTFCDDKDFFVLGSPIQTMNRVYASDVDLNIPPLIVNKGDGNEIDDCSQILGDNGLKLIKGLKTLLTIIVPIILLVMGSLDFAKAVFASDENNIKKAQGTFIKRVIICFVIFLSPSVLHFILRIAKVVWPVIDDTLCGIL